MFVNVDLIALATNADYFSTLTATTAAAPSLSFLVYNQTFATSVLGPNATGTKIADLPWQAFHEGGVYHQPDNSVYVASNYVSLSDPINITVISLDDYSIRSTHFPHLAAANGGTTYYPPGTNFSALTRPPQQVWCDEGTFDSPSQLLAVDPTTNTSEPLLTSFLGGRNFSSLNDVRQHPITGDLWFTDADYGYFQHFRPAPTIPKQVYRFDPKVGNVQVVADGFTQPNGLEFSPDLRTLYVTDTGAGQFDTNNTRPTTIYALDINEDNKTLGAKRMFAFSDIGTPDGIHADIQGNVWAAAGDGVHVWNPEGLLLGKIFLGETSNNFAFIPNGMLVFSNYRLWKVDGIKAQGREVCKDFGFGCENDPTYGANDPMSGENATKNGAMIMTEMKSPWL